ncbi:FkbM family methyltransferase [Bradyrhizobium sp. ARR65]|uniref:FkbM family methyltransferase n=1 Tax=Bradyrhizobium sp. ARR65 TaxID=1040989 RepID=UPI0004637A43|nr:FkbM family methyltransferase [Bradyrhizobium sp. ARR65]
MNYANPLLIRIRGLAQQLHILRPIVRIYRMILSEAYERKFRDLLLTKISEGDLVWDVGANVGLYTRLFADRVGRDGRVIAFEPSPRAFAQLQSSFATEPNVILQQIALSDFDGEADFYVAERGPTVTDSLVVHSGSSASIRTPVKRGDSMYSIKAPAIIKIDVEGAELEVLKGMTKVLGNPGLRGVFVEVHFLALARRGMRTAPAEIQKILQQAGFQVAWTDASHIAGLRKSTLEHQR